MMCTSEGRESTFNFQNLINLNKDISTMKQTDEKLIPIIKSKMKFLYNSSSLIDLTDKSRLKPES